MGGRDRQFRSPAGRGVVAAAVIVLVPIVAVSVAGAVGRGVDVSSVVALILVSGGAIWAITLASRTAAFVTYAPDSVTVGLTPLWRTRLAREDIAIVSLVEVNAYAEYGGWGIKGSCRSPRGRLYSVGGSASVRIAMKDGRVFLVSFARAEAAEEAVEALGRA